MCALQVLQWYLERNLSVTPVHPVCLFYLLLFSYEGINHGSIMCCVERERA